MFDDITFNGIIQPIFLQMASFSDAPGGFAHLLRWFEDGIHVFGVGAGIVNQTHHRTAIQVHLTLDVQHKQFVIQLFQSHSNLTFSHHNESEPIEMKSAKELKSFYSVFCV
jgi:hypothetical protein